jgi:arylsulfatase
MGRLSENSVLNLKNKSHTVTAQIEVPDADANGVIIAQGGEFGGWSLFLVDGRPRYCYNLFGLRQFHIGAESLVPPGEHQIRMEFAYDGGGLGKGGTATLYVDGGKVGQGRVEATVPMVFSADETADLGTDTASPVADDYPTDPRFTGRILWVQLDAGGDDQDHLISPEERMRVAMTRQ